MPFMSDIIVPGGWGERLESIMGSKRHTLALVGVVGLAVMIGILALGGRAPAVAPPATHPMPAAVVTPTPAASPAVVLVHVSGAVRAPGLYQLPEGARVADAIELAGGPAPKADLDALNLAEPVVDGTKVHVPEMGESPPPASAIASPTASPAPIDINAADVTALETIPGIGPAKAAAIVAHREQVGSFDSVDQLLEVQGIGPATLEALRPYVTV